MASENQLKQVGEDRIIPESKSNTFFDEAATSMLLLGIKTLSQRALVAISNLFTLLCTASAFALWYSVLPSPNSYQLVGLGLYGMFILLLHLVRKK